MLVLGSVSVSWTIPGNLGYQPMYREKTSVNLMPKRQKKTDEKGGLSFEVLSNVPIKRMDDGWKLEITMCIYIVVYYIDWILIRYYI